VRNLKNLGFRVPLAIVNKAHQANQLYPFAISLIESVRTYERTLEKVISPPFFTHMLIGCFHQLCVIEILKHCFVWGNKGTQFVAVIIFVSDVCETCFCAVTQHKYCIVKPRFSVPTFSEIPDLVMIFLCPDNSCI
jgi:hypothetical protein